MDTVNAGNSEAKVFSLDRDKARRELLDPAGGAIWPINRFSDADELHCLVSAAIEDDVIAVPSPGDRIRIHPRSLSDPQPLLAVKFDRDPKLLGDPVAMHGADGEDPVEFTVRLLGEVVDQASRLASTWHDDAACLDRLAAYLNQPGQ